MAWAIMCITVPRNNLTAINDAGAKLWEPFQVESIEAGGKVCVWLKREYWFNNDDPPIPVTKDGIPIPN